MKQDKEKLCSTQYIMYVLMQTCSFLIYYISTPIITSYSTSLGFDLGFAGLLSGVFAIASVLSRPVAGFLTDRVNRKRCMLGSMMLITLANFGFVFFTVGTVLLFCRILYGIGFAIFSTTLISCATDVIPKTRLGEGIGYIGLGTALAAAIGPGIGLFLSERLGYHMLFIVLGFCCIAFEIWLIFIRIMATEHIQNKISIDSFFEPKAIPYVILVVAFSYNVGIINSFIAYTAEQRGIDKISIFFTVYAVAMLLLKPLSGKLLDKKGLTAVLLPSFIFAAAAMGILSKATTLTLFLAAALFLAFGQGAGQPSIQTRCVQLVDDSRRGVAVSTYYIGLDIGNGVGPIIGGQIAEKYGYSTTYTTGMIILLIAMAAYVLGIRISRKPRYNSIC